MKLSFKTILLVGLVVTSFLSGYFYSMGEDFWKLTKEAPLMNPFWFVSVPIGVLGIILIIYGLKRKTAVAPAGKMVVVRPRSIKDLLIKLIDFQNSWSDKWRPLIETGDLRKPQNGEISWYSDQLRIMLARIASEGISLKLYVEKQIREFAADAGKLGARVLRTFNDKTGADPITCTFDIKQSFLNERKT